MATRSYWFEQSMLALREAFKNLPADAEPKLIKQTAAEAYPFGPPISDQSLRKRIAKGWPGYRYVEGV